MSTTSPRADPYTVEIGAERIVLPGPSDTGGDFEIVERTVTFECLSRGLITGIWRGIVVGELLESAAVPGETTRLVVTADDGHSVRLPIPDAIDALLALSRVDEAGTTHTAGMPRFVGPSLDGTRTIKNVARIEPVPVTSSRNSVGRNSDNLP